MMHHTNKLTRTLKEKRDMDKPHVRLKVTIPMTHHDTT
jgi:hypothetical protein